MKKKDRIVLDAVSDLDDEMLDRHTAKRFQLLQALRMRMKKRNLMIGGSAAACILVACVVLFVVLFPGFGGMLGTPINPRQVPIYQGMTVSGSLPSTVASVERVEMPVRFAASMPLGGTELLTGNETVSETETETDSLQPESAEPMYYAKPGEMIYITVHFDNPDQFEIISFTLNGEKKQVGMAGFEVGYDLQTITVPMVIPADAEGVISYTIDAIKYIDGEELKDVRMEGDDTVSVTVMPEEQPSVTTAAQTVGFNDLTVSANVTDPKGLIAASTGGKLYAVLYNGDEIVARKELMTGEISVVFDELLTNTLYQYAIVGIYDALDGEGTVIHILHESSFYTKAPILFEDVSLVGDTFRFSFHRDEAAEVTVDSLTLYRDGVSEREIETDASMITSLEAGKSYRLVATYTWNGKQEEISVEFETASEWGEITLVTNGGEELGTVKLAKGDVLPTPVREGYTFGGWFSDVGQTQQLSTAPGVSTTLYAWWKEETPASKLDYESFNEYDGSDVCIRIEGMNDSALNKLVIPAYIGGLRVVWIGESAFSGSKLEEITLPDSINRVGHFAFDSMHLKTEVVDGVRYFGNWAIGRDGSRKSIVIREGTVGIADCAFSDSSLTELTIHTRSFKYLGALSFYNCEALKTVYVDDANILATVQRTEHERAPWEYGASLRLINGDPVTHIAFPEGMTEIPYHACYGMRDLTSVTIPDTVTIIGEGAFAGCSDLESVVIPDSVTHIEYGAFKNCTNLKSVTLPNQLEMLGGEAFAGCANLKNSILPDSLSELSRNAFAGCELLFEVEDDTYYIGSWLYAYQGTATNVAVREGTKYLFNDAFVGCSSIKTVVLPQSLKKIGGAGLFGGCNALTSVEFFNGIENINLKAFNNCRFLRTIVFHGTQAEWEAIPKTGTFDGGIVIQCVNGEINAGEIWEGVILGALETIVGSTEIIRDYYPNSQVFNPSTGDYRSHRGIDIAAESETPVCSVAEGIVSEIWDCSGYGPGVVVEYQNSIYIRYMNLNFGSIEVHVGDTVEAGQILGYIEGRKTEIPYESEDETHLHLEMEKDGYWVDPLKYLIFN